MNIMRKRLQRTLAGIVIAASFAATAMSVSAADNVVTGEGQATGTVPVTINVTGLTIKATLPTGLNLAVNTESLLPADVVTSTVTITNQTKAGGMTIPINVSYGKLGGTFTGITVKDKASDVNADIASPTAEMALALKSGANTNYLTPELTDDAYTQQVVDNITYTVDLYSSPAFKFKSGSFTGSVVFKISLY